MAVIADADRHSAGNCSSAAAVGGELAQGYYSRPTVFGGVDNCRTASRTEDRDVRARWSRDRSPTTREAVSIANHSSYGLNAFVRLTTWYACSQRGRRLESGSGVESTSSATHLPQGPYGSYKQSGFGAPAGARGLYEFPSGEEHPPAWAEPLPAWWPPIKVVDTIRPAARVFYRSINSGHLQVRIHGWTR
ncbi:MAG: aldehyde dehydrogenase family protein [Mycolicibacterium sp.]|nr:aldehyde dehydrogenase family protein [Mycolicibacterium sp.]